MKKIDELITKFQEFKEELNKNVNQSYAPQSNSTHMANSPSNSFMSKTEVIKTDKNGQWSLEKDFSGPTARALAAKHPMKPAAPVEHSGPAARALAAKHPMPSAAEASAGKKNSILDARRANVLKVDPEENVNIPHPKGKAKMSDGVNKGEGANEKAASSKPHNKGKFKVMDEVEEKNSKKEDVKGLPYSSKNKK